MIKCPYCPWEGPPQEFLKHIETHSGEDRIWFGLINRDSLEGLLEDMLVALDREDFESLLKASVEASVIAGRYYDEGGWKEVGHHVYGDIAIVLLSAYKEDWVEARGFLDDAKKYFARYA